MDAFTTGRYTLHKMDYACCLGCHVLLSCDCVQSFIRDLARLWLCGWMRAIEVGRLWLGAVPGILGVPAGALHSPLRTHASSLRGPFTLLHTYVFLFMAHLLCCVLARLVITASSLCVP